MTHVPTTLVAGRSVGDIVQGNATLGDLIDALAVSRPDRAAVTDANGTLTFRELRAGAFRLAKALHQAGVRRGDAVGILMGNRAEWIVSCFAAQYLGAAVVAINTWYTPHELGYVLAHAEVRVLIMARRFCIVTTLRCSARCDHGIS